MNIYVLIWFVEQVFVACAQYEAVLDVIGVVNELPEPNKAPPVDEVYQSIVTPVTAVTDITVCVLGQIVIAVGEGAKAALSAFDYLIKEY